MACNELQIALRRSDTWFHLTSQLWPIGFLHTLHRFLTLICTLTEAQPLSQTPLRLIKPKSGGTIVNDREKVSEGCFRPDPSWAELSATVICL